MSKTKIKDANALKALRIFMLCFFAYTVSYIGRKGFSAGLTEISQTLAMSRTFSGAISTGYLACYGGGQLINGLLSDRISPKYMITAGLFGAGVCNTLMGLVSAPYTMLIVWCMNGLFNSMLWSSVIRAISEWLPHNNQPVACTAIEATVPVGTVIAYAVSSVCLKFFSWRISFFVSGSCLFAVCAVWFISVSSLKNYIEKTRLANAALNASVVSNGSENSDRVSRVSLVKCIFGAGLVTAVIGILFNGIIKDGVTEWVPAFITERFSVPAATAVSASMLLPVINLSGAFVAKKVNDRLNNEMASASVMFLICVISMTLLYVCARADIIPTVVLLAVATSAMLGANNLFLTRMPLYFSPVGRTASVTGFLNACSYLSASLSSVLIGRIADKAGWNSAVIFWMIASAAGLAACIVGISLWKRGREKIKQLS